MLWIIVEVALNSSEQMAVSSVAEDALSPIGLFAAKTIIIASVVTTSIIIIGALLPVFADGAVNRLSAGIERTTKIGGSQFWARVEQELDKAGDPTQGLSPEKQRALLNQLRRISDKWRPFLTEAYAIVTEPPDPSKGPSRAPIGR
jgi:hypothetical protein